MVGKNSIDPLGKRTPGLKSYFFLDGVLYHKIWQDVAQDLMIAENMQENQKVYHFLLSDVKRKAKNAYNTVEVARMLNRHRVKIQGYVNDGRIKRPVEIREHGMNARGVPFTTLKWSDEDILALHDYLLTAPKGPPRKDGILKSAPGIPSRRELLAILNNQPMFYMKTASGELVPVWSAHSGA